MHDDYARHSMTYTFKSEQTAKVSSRRVLIGSPPDHLIYITELVMTNCVQMNKRNGVYRCWLFRLLASTVTVQAYYLYHYRR